MSSTANAQMIPVSKPKQPYPQYLGGIAASIAASITHPLDLTKVRLQASGDTGMIQSLKKTVRTAGVRGLFDGVSATLFRQMTYSMCRFWAYDESKKYLGAGTPRKYASFDQHLTFPPKTMQAKMRQHGNLHWQAVWPEGSPALSAILARF
ncbi:Mitochondrial dicarboxylate transporter [Tulasnella sp. 425]|nr:Mitochondrial dicarboxylate transporter [Tulasnella sp. 425]